MDSCDVISKKTIEPIEPIEPIETTETIEISEPFDSPSGDYGKNVSEVFSFDRRVQELFDIIIAFQMAELEMYDTNFLANATYNNFYKFLFQGK